MRPAFVRKYGEGARQAIAIHCSLAHSGAWSGIAQELGDRLTFLAPDLPSHGKADLWDEARDLHDQSTAEIAGMLTGRIDLIGHSFGAMVALRLALEHPEMVRSLSLIEPVFFIAARAHDNPDILRRHEEKMAPFATAFGAGDRVLAARSFNRVWGDGRGWDNIPERLRDYMVDRIHLVPAQDPALSEDRAELLAPGRLEGLTMPVAMIEGAESPEIISAIHTVLAGRLPNVRRHIVDGAGHMLPITHPKQVAAAIENLLDMTEE